LTEAEYRRVSYDFTIVAAETLVAKNPAMIFIYVSGTGTDGSGKSRMMWARVKGETENRLIRMPFRAAYMFRPGIIEPRRGVRAAATGTRILYAVLGPPLFPILRALFPNSMTSTDRVGRAMIRAASRGSDKRYFENPDINALAADG
jgi:uncharacterized protein YbjT (DUF2867 family)